MAERWASETRLPDGTTFYQAVFEELGDFVQIELDTGIDVPRLLGDPNLSTVTSTVLVDLASTLDSNGDGQLDDYSILCQSLVGFKNASTRTMSIRVCYFASFGASILDFLVALQPRSHLVLHPFLFEIPASGGENVLDRVFGPSRPGRVFTPIPTSIFGDGKFVLQGTAVEEPSESVPDIDSLTRLERNSAGGFRLLTTALPGTREDPELLRFVQQGISGSTFISHADEDKMFAKKLRNDLRKHGIKTYLACEDLRPGQDLLEAMDENVLSHRHLIVILSEYSIHSWWVEGEVRAALEKERAQTYRCLIPIMLDKEVMSTEKAWAKWIRNRLYIADFSAWQEVNKYRKAIEQLLEVFKD